MSAVTEQEGLSEVRTISCDLRPLISIVIPAYNAAQFLGDAIESALRQTYRPIEIVIVDDGSGDSTLKIARQYAEREPDTIRVLSQSNSGACAARNHGLRVARGNWIKFLDADDALTPDAISSQLSALDGEPDVIPFGAIIHCDAVLRPKAAGKVRHTAMEALSEDMAVRVAWLLEHNLQTARPLHPRVWIERIGGFNEQLLRAQEYDLHLRLALAGARFKAVEEVGVLLRDHDDPHRITNRGSALRAQMPRNRIQPETNRLLEAAFGPEFPPPVRRVRARTAWRVLRTRVQNGNLPGALEKAAEGKRLDPTFEQVRGKGLRWAYRLLGPLAAERSVAIAKRIIRQ